MSVSRRRLLHSVALAGACSEASDGAESALPLDVLRNVSAAHGANLSEERLRAVKPVLEQRLPQLRALRNFTLEDTVEPTQGILY